MLFTVELKKESGRNEVFIHCDTEGLDFLIWELTKLRRYNEMDDLHFVTEAWNGHELTETRIEPDTTVLINHLRLDYFPDGFSEDFQGMLFTVELENEPGREQVFGYCDTEGLELLIWELAAMRRLGKEGAVSFKTEAKKGPKLAEERIDPDKRELVQHLSVKYYPDELPSQVD